MNTYILVINPGSTSTKIAVFDKDEPLFEQTLRHTNEELATLKNIDEQYRFRKEVLLDTLKEKQFDPAKLDMIISRGGLLKPIESGIYEVNNQMIEDLKNSTLQHASNLGAMMAKELAEELNIQAYIADPVVVDELSEVARYSGHPNFPRKSVFHALNQKAIARQYAKQNRCKYEELNLIVVHLGGGVSVGAHQAGRVIDVNQALDGEGPFSPERSGTLPVGDLIRAAFSGEYTKEELLKMVVGEGGMVAYCGSNDAYKVELSAIGGNKDAAMAYKAMAYQVAKEIGAMSTVLKGNVDAILITGGLARSEYLVDMIKDSIKHLGKVAIFPGEDEMKALAMNALLLKRKEIVTKEYN
ncbi:butyrate kinase [Limibacter armeniacum]|uniref:butyrate kinase n=1 Tax=Limibacter armeniacum TaxID=466084 RepID=UPI002FE61BFF